MIQPEPLPTPTWMPTNQLVPNPDNPRFIRDAKFKRLIKSVKESPWMLQLRPIIITESNVVLGGNMRLEACRAAGIDSVPVIHARNLTPSQIQEFIIKDNVGYGEWDWEVLANNWDIEVLKEWDLEIPDMDQAPGQPSPEGDKCPECGQNLKSKKPKHGKGK